MIEEPEVHIRFSPGEGPRLTYCLKPVDELISTTMENIRWWRGRRPICRGCEARRRDVMTAVAEQAVAS